MTVVQENVLGAMKGAAMRLYWVGRDVRPGPETASRFLIKFLIKFSADTDILVSTYL